MIKQDKLIEADTFHKRAEALGMVIPQTEEKQRESIGVDTGTIVAVGDLAWKQFDVAPWAVLGDRVAFAKYAGKVFKDPSDMESVYLVINDEDIIAVIGADIDAKQ